MCKGTCQECPIHVTYAQTVPYTYTYTYTYLPIYTRRTDLREVLEISSNGGEPYNSQVADAAKIACDIFPQANDGTQSTSMAATSSRHQTVHFLDEAAHHIATVNPLADPVRDYAISQDVPLDEFLSRPIKIISNTWEVGAGFARSFDPWALYLNSTTVKSRIGHYRMLRGRLRLKVTLSGTHFHYGRILVDYLPLHQFDGYGARGLSGYTEAEFIEASQRMHLWLNPTTSKGGEMLLPFLWPTNALDIAASQGNQMGLINMHATDSGLQHALGDTTSNVTVNIYAWMEDFKYGIPTHVAPQASETNNPGIVSRVSTTIAGIAMGLVNTPVIGPYAKATEIGARAMGAIGALFGFSRPVLKDTSMFRPRTKPNIAVTNVPDDLAKLSVDVNQEMTIDPRVGDLSPVDELSIKYLATKESFLTTFAWNAANTAETLLWNAICDPSLCASSPATNGAIEYNMTPLAFVGVPFSFWKGTMKFRFQVVCSGVHRGRLRVTWDPVKTNTSPGPEAYNTQYSTVIDIGETSDFTIECGWGQTTSYRPVRPMIEVHDSFMFGTSPVSYDSRTDPYGNGTLAVYVVNELVAPGTAGADVHVIVSVMGGDDIEFAAPESRSLTELRLSDYSSVVSPQSLETIFPQSDEEGDPGLDVIDSSPTNSDPIDSQGAPVSLTDHTNDVFFGEKITSMRQLLKRYCNYMTMPTQTGVAYALRQQFMNVYPTYPGWYATTATAQGDTIARFLDGSNPRYYLYGNTTLLQFLGSAFVGYRGSIRWMVDASQSDYSEHFLGNFDDDNLQETEYYPIPSGAYGSPEWRASILDGMKRTTGYNGMTLESTSVQPVISAELPFYSNLRFNPCRVRQDLDVADGFQLKMTYTALMTKTTDKWNPSVAFYCAAGEDFNFLCFVGVPKYYYYGSITPFENPLP